MSVQVFFFQELLPLAYTFELLPCQSELDYSCPLLQQIQRLFSVTVSFRPSCHNLSSMVIVKGTVLNSKNVKDATLRLMDMLTGQVGFFP